MGHLLNISTYNIWIGGSCDYGHKERAGAAAVIIEHDTDSLVRYTISDLHTTEFRMMLTLMIRVMKELPEGADITFMTNVAYLQNFDKMATQQSDNNSGESGDNSNTKTVGKSSAVKAKANADLILQCIAQKRRHNSVGVKIVQYHKSPLLIETHNMARDAMNTLRRQYQHTKKAGRT